jgi:hypothetical protein
VLNCCYAEVIVTGSMGSNEQGLTQSLVSDNTWWARKVSRKRTCEMDYISKLVKFLQCSAALVGLIRAGSKSCPVTMRHALSHTYIHSQTSVC